MVNRGIGRHQAFVGLLQGRVALHLERKVVQPDLPLLCWLRALRRFEQGEVVVDNAAGQKGPRAIGTIPGKLETYHIPVELRGPLHITDIEYQMADLLRYTHRDCLSVASLPCVCRGPRPLRVAGLPLAWRVAIAPWDTRWLLEAHRAEAAGSSARVPLRVSAPPECLDWPGTPCRCLRPC